MTVTAVAPRPLRAERPLAPVRPSPVRQSAPLAPRQLVDRMEPARQQQLRPVETPFDDAYWRQIDTYARRGPGAASDVAYLREHGAAWRERLALVNGAQREIFCSCYYIEGDEYGVAFVEALLAAQRRGVQVVLGLDTIAMRATKKDGDPEHRRLLQQRLDELRAAGGLVRHFAPFRQQLHSIASGNHAKMLEIDGERALVGGRNVGGDYYGHLFNDFEMRFTGQIARQFESDLITMMNRARPESDEADARWRQYRDARPQRPIAIVRTPQTAYHVVTWDPVNDGERSGERPNRITQALIATITRARREVTLTSNYVVGHPDLRRALMDAAARGVRVRVITTGESASHVSKMAYWATRPGYFELARAGVQIYETQNTPDHAKIYVIDDVAAFGSYNFSDYSDAKLAETLVFTSEQRDVRVMRQVLEESMERSVRFDPEHPPKLSFWQFLLKLLGSAIYFFRTL